MKLLKLKKSNFLILLFSCLTFLSQLSYAQEKAVTGKVIDAQTSESIIGATVKVKGTNKGVATDVNGVFRLNAPANATLEVASIGYKTVEVKADFAKDMVIEIASDNKLLNEVVVVGYGTQKRTTLAGSVATVDAKVFQDRGPISNPLAALQGQVPGVTVTRSSAQPGRENWNFLVRGNSSVNTADPLIIVDGMPLPGISALNSFNPADINNISFLKDAAAAIYGARAAGGVVLITTKRAKTGKTAIEYNASVSRKDIGLQPKLVDIGTWGRMIKDARSGGDGFPATDIWNDYADMTMWAVQNNKTYLSKAEATALNFGVQFRDVRDFVFFPGTMQDVLWGNATSTEHQLSLSSRTEKSGYRISLGYLDDGSLLQWGNNSNNRYNVRLGHDYQFSPKLKLQTNISLEKGDIVQPSNIGAVLNNGIQPGLPLTTINGKPYVWGSGIGNATTNNIAQYGGDSKEYNTRLNTNFNLIYDLTQNLKANGSAGYYLHNADFKTNENLITFYDYAEATPNRYTPTNNGRPFYQRSSRKEVYYSLNGFLEWAKVFSESHDVRVMAGAQYERDEVNRIFGRTLETVPGVPPSLSLGTGDATTRLNAEDQNHYGLGGYFGRADYTFKNKYIFQTNFRYDGSSKFDADNRWKLFYGVLGAWRITQEKFMEKIGFINELKLKASWGTAGNQSGIDLYDYLPLLNLNTSPGANNRDYPIIGTSPVVKVAPGNLVALDRTWEKVTTRNIGLDFSVLKSHLSGSVEYFIKNNDNMLIARTAPAVLGANPPKGNNGNLRTNGWDLSLNWRSTVGALSYRFGGNISHYKNKLVDFGGQNILSSGNRGLNAAVEGYPINSFFGMEYAGRIQTQEQLDEYKKLVPGNDIGMPTGGPSTQANQRLALGDNMFKDRNGDGKLTFQGDAMFLGSDDPNWTYSMNGGLDYKGFDFNFILQGIGERTIIRDGNWRIPGAVIFQSQNAAFVDQYWTPTRTEALLPRPSTTGTINNYNYLPSDWVTENGAYVRLKNLALGYTIPQSIVQKARIQKVRIYLSGSDLWESSKIRDGWDPEATRGVGNGGDPNNNNQSTFSQRYPMYRFYTMGLNVTL